MQKNSRKEVIEIFDKLLTVLACGERKQYDKATTAAREAAEMCSQLHHQVFRKKRRP